MMAVGMGRSPPERTCVPKLAQQFQRPCLQVRQRDRVRPLLQPVYPRCRDRRRCSFGCQLRGDEVRAHSAIRIEPIEIIAGRGGGNIRDPGPEATDYFLGRLLDNAVCESRAAIESCKTGPPFVSGPNSTGCALVSPTVQA
jgi:hypothetical protein